jgi:GntR family transcriptional regulator
MSKNKASTSRFVTDEVPLYYQLSTLIKEQILSGRYGPGDRLPTEAELVADYGVSRITVRQALKALETEELIRREAGRGTFVTGIRHLPEQLQMPGTLDDLITMGLATSVKLLDLHRVAATREDAEAFGIEIGEPVVECNRLRYYEEIPYSYITNRLPVPIAEKFEDHDWESGSILNFIEDKIGLHLRDADQTVRATLAGAVFARLLETRIAAPLLLVERTVYTDTGMAVERVRTVYRGDIYALNVHLTRDPQKSRELSDWTLKRTPEDSG